jgi:hypothetical protein
MPRKRKEPGCAELIGDFILGIATTVGSCLEVLLMFPVWLAIVLIFVIFYGALCYICILIINGLS